MDKTGHGRRRTGGVDGEEVPAQVGGDRRADGGLSRARGSGGGDRRGTERGEGGEKKAARVRGRADEGADQRDRGRWRGDTFAVPGGPNRMALYCGGPTGIVAAVSAGTAGAAGARRGDCGSTLAGRSYG